MKTRFLSAALLLCTLMSYGQGEAIYLIFTARNNTTYVQLDSIKIINRTSGGDTVLYWNDTVLSICYVGLPGGPGKVGRLQLYQNLPDPVTGQSNFSVQVPERDKVVMIATDMAGRQILCDEKVLGAGMHSFRLTSGAGKFCLLTAIWRETRSNIKILPAESGGDGQLFLEYLGAGSATPRYRSTAQAGNFLFNPGDELLYTGYANGAQSGIRDHPASSQDYTFQFATGTPCPGMPSIYYEGREYPTVQVFSQCWLKENLNVGTLINPGVNQADNGIMEKYCLEDSEDSCSKYGGLYQWDEAMQYTQQPGAQGLCPQGWHIPDDEDWKLLEGAVDSQFGIGHPEWDNISYRGFDAGVNLKSVTGWYANGGGTDPFGFSGLPCGYSFIWGYFWKTGREAHWWTSTEINDYAWNRLISYNYNKIHRLNFEKVHGFNIRCLKN